MPATLTTSKLQEAIEVVEALPEESQEALIEIIRRRLAGEERKRLIESVAESRAQYAAGNYKVGTARELMAEIESCDE
jgi:hypothetical protein